MARMANDSGRAASPAESPAHVWGIGFIGMLFGSMLSQDFWGAASGAVLGALIAHLRGLRARIGILEADLFSLRAQPTADAGAEAVARRPEADPSGVEQGTTAEADPSGAAQDMAAEADPSSIGQDMAAEAGRERGYAQVPSTRVSPERSPESVTAGPSSESASGAAPPASAASPSVPPPQVSSQEPSPPSLAARGLGAVRSFFFGGNTVVRAGLLVLLVGLTLLAKYAADNALFPIEARLAFGALIGLVLVAVGYRQRTDRPGFGMSLQGGGIAALYLITFFAFKFYGLIPSGLAFGLFVALALATVMLSVLQKSEPLVVIGSLGGFLAPVLASTGGGSHVALFSYYLLLITAIGLVAWRESWRVPGLVAFFCTYAVAGAWGVLRYKPEHFASTEPFVIAFMTLFTGIAFLHATREKSQLRGVVDGTLVFGTAFVSILIQGALVRDRELGLALSAGGFGAFYMAWAMLLWRRSVETMRPLAEAFLALAIGFTTMAIPFAFDEALTTAIAWALEGAGLYWVGARQSRVLPRVAGFALQILAALAFVVSVAFESIDTELFLPLANGRALSCLSLAFAGFFIARMAYVDRARLRPFETALAQGLGITGLLWWTGGSFAEIEQFVHDDLQVSVVLLWIASTLGLLEVGGKRFGWRPGRMMALVGLPAAAMSIPLSLDVQDHLLADGGWLAWPVVFAGLYFLWERLKDEAPAQLLLFRAGLIWLAALFSGLVLAGLADAVFALTGDWQLAGFGLGLSAALFGALALDARGWSPFDRELEQARWVGLAPVAGVMLLAIVGFQFSANGDASPIPHVPILNPVDLVVGLLALGVFAVWRSADAGLASDWRRETTRALALTALAIAFICLNGVLVRAVHQWGGVPLDADRLWDSSAMQVTLSIAWTVVGLVGMLLSSRRGWREAWMGFAALLAVVVVKMFTVDLSQLSTVARIGTFLAVGAMLLVLGYLSPVPPGEGDGADPDLDRAVEGEAS